MSKIPMMCWLSASAGFSNQLKETYKDKQARRLCQDVVESTNEVFKVWGIRLDIEKNKDDYQKFSKICKAMKEFDSLTYNNPDFTAFSKKKRVRVAIQHICLLFAVFNEIHEELTNTQSWKSGDKKFRRKVEAVEKVNTTLWELWLYVDRSRTHYCEYEQSHQLIDNWNKALEAA